MKTKDFILPALAFGIGAFLAKSNKDASVGAVQFSNTKEFYDMQKEFERVYEGLRLDKEAKEFYPKQHFYQNGEANDKFIAFMNGYQVAKSIYQ